MAKGDKCPYCGGRADRIEGRVGCQPTHLSFGYGERLWKCRKCGEVFSVCYAIPPKGGRSDMPEPHKGIIKVSFTEGVRGYADPVVLRADAPAFPEKAAQDSLATEEREVPEGEAE